MSKLTYQVNNELLLRFLDKEPGEEIVLEHEGRKYRFTLVEQVDEYDETSVKITGELLDG